jgi:hypothetical protein
MLFVIALTAFIAVWKLGLRTSTKFSRTTWELLAHLQFVTFVLCAIGFSYLQQKPRYQPAKPATTPYTAAVQNTPSSAGHVSVVDRASSPKVFLISSETPRTIAAGQAVTIKGFAFSPIVTYEWSSASNCPSYMLYSHLQTWTTHSNGSIAPGPVHLHFQTQSDPFPIRQWFRAPAPVVVEVSSNTETSHGLLYWVTLFGLIMMPLGIISTNILAWMTYRRQKAEAILQRAEDARLRQLELQKLKREIRKLRLTLQHQSRR